MKVRDIMSTRVVSIAPDANVLEAVRLMLQNHISGLPVIDRSGALVGVVTEGDFLRRSETGTERKRPRWLEFLMGPRRLADEYVHTHARKVEDVMTREPITITEDAALDEVVRIMERRRIKRLPVVRGAQVIGIVSRANLLHALASLGFAGVSDVKIGRYITLNIDAKSADEAKAAASKMCEQLLANPNIEDFRFEVDG